MHCGKHKIHALKTLAAKICRYRVCVQFPFFFFGNFPTFFFLLELCDQLPNSFPNRNLKKNNQTICIANFIMYLKVIVVVCFSACMFARVSIVHRNIITKMPCSDHIRSNTFLWIHERKDDKSCGTVPKFCGGDFLFHFLSSRCPLSIMPDEPWTDRKCNLECGPQQPFLAAGCTW